MAADKAAKLVATNSQKTSKHVQKVTGNAWLPADDDYVTSECAIALPIVMLMYV